MYFLIRICKSIIYLVSHETFFNLTHVLYLLQKISYFAQRVAFGILLSFERPQDCHFRLKSNGKIRVRHYIETMKDQTNMAEGGAFVALTNEW